MLNYLQIQEDALTRFQGNSNGISNYPSLPTWVNLHYTELNADQDWPWLTKTIDFSLTQGIASTNLYTLDTQYRRELDVRITDLGYATKLKKINPRMIDKYIPRQVDSNSQGTPVYYWLWENSIYTWPIPDKTYTIELRYFFDASDLQNDTDTPVTGFPRQAIQIISLQTYADLLRDAFMFDQANAVEIKVQDLLTKLRDTAILPDDDGEPLIDLEEPSWDRS